MLLPDVAAFFVRQLRLSSAKAPAYVHAYASVCADLASRLVKAPPKRVAQLAASTEIIAERLLRLRDIFPQVIQLAMAASAD